MTSEPNTADGGLDDLLNRHFPGKVVRKDLTKLVKEGANVVYVKKFQKLLVGRIWSNVPLEYFYEEDQKGSPFLLRDLKPIQMPNMDLEELFQGRRAFTEPQWIDALLRSTGMEPTNFT